ncbi:MAG: YggS family pyridoxal phosphate-dependent enzyme [Flavobacteriaceae bacterium]|tara:strand:+ start:6251 stop:6901 length:651 start_codon:yes stop_codon:yes gene_type:complete
MIQKKIKEIRDSINKDIELVAVSKTKSKKEILEAYNAGQKVFGENKIQEMTVKHEELPKDIKWHMVGHVQSNKIKYMAPYVELVHGIDSLKSVKILNKEAKKNNRVIKCLLQLKISDEFTKFGLSKIEIESILNSINILGLKNINVAGIMTIGSFTENMNVVIKEFEKSKKIFDELKITFPNLKILSMGMSNDYKMAIKHGSNMIRVGSLIFGKRI